MATPDLFGLHRERKIAESGVRKVFTPHMPVNSVQLFFGRADEVKSIISQINTPGQHALLYGDRGVGKSSLANIATTVLYSGKIMDGSLYKRRCDSRSTFEWLLEGPLKDVGVDIDVTKVTKSHIQGGSANLGITGLGAGIKSDRTTSSEHRGEGDVSPSRACELLKKHQGLLLIDEMEAIKDPAVKWKLAEFIKQLSDENSPFKVLAVGIAQTGAALTNAHPSVGRCLKETKLEKMRDKELHEIVVRGAGQLKLTYADEVIESIVRLSAGYPHFTHLLALKCAEDAIAENRKTVGRADLGRALTGAVKDAEGTLRRAYESATLSHATDMYKQILCAAAGLTGTEFTADDLRAAIAHRTGQSITQGALNNYLKRLVSDSEDTILMRRAVGVYAFNDPRMPSYVRIANALL